MAAARTMALRWICQKTSGVAQEMRLHLGLQQTETGIDGLLVHPQRL
jgi:hypothetical protein